jgi:sphinganine-1-phosphate aldolase|tara:strand:+ start:477 stop:1031 length:555 start_codon:yes stop_codon:yes gene_type:complete
MYWCYADWTGGLYCTPTMAGSRAGSASAACWASMMQMGKDGYMEAATKIVKTRQDIQAGIESIPGIKVMGDPKAMVVAFESSSLNVYRIADKMSHLGWSINSLQRPSSVHICVTYPTTQDGVVDKFLTDLRDCVEGMMRDLVAGGKNGKEDKGGDAPIYGMTASLPKGPVNTMLNSYIDVVLEV